MDPWEQEAAAGIDTAAADETSQEFLGRWNALISTTNWEKGRIIAEWRAALVESGAAPAQYSDEAWSRRVGHVSGQHAGRLRRVYERFGSVRSTYTGLYWSHFCVAIDWDDAELWLEGASQSEWSVSEMRTQRAEALGQVAAPAEVDDPSADFDEDVDINPIAGTMPTPIHAPESGDRTGSELDHSSRAVNDEALSAAGSVDPWGFSDQASSASAPVDGAPSHAIPAGLPTDLAEAFDGLKLCVLRHKLSGWQEVSRSDVLAGLQALIALIDAPAE